MAQTQIADVVVPAEFSAYIVENSKVSTAIFQFGVAVPNGLISEQLQTGSTQFTVPVWSDDGESETDVTSDNIAVLSTPLKLTAVPQVVRKSFLHQSWSEMSLASELAGSEALARVQSRVQAYWDRQYERRIIASMLGVLYSNVANNASDIRDQQARQPLPAQDPDSRGTCGRVALQARPRRDRSMTALEARAPRNVLIVATANKLARIAWAVLSTGQDYRAVPDVISA
jgi:hypothetical protein